MAHESFEDDEVAAYLNEHFVSIKVDREERPDIDHIYMTVCQAMTGQGGWPLTVILTPDQHPVFAGTYFPKRRRFGRIGLLELLEQIQSAWRQDPDRIRSSGAKIVRHLRTALTAQGGAGESPDASVLQTARRQLEEMYDPVYGGFGEAPKFPTPHQLVFLLRYGRLYADAKAVEMAAHTLERMHRGGLYDHVGFGFSRYSSDRRWLVPHFEKMLYDNALLALAYTEGYQATGRPLFARVCREVLTYLLRDMRHPEGAFHAAEDADSEGMEGRYYLWTPEEVRAVLGDPLGDRYCRCFDITASGNFEGRSIPNLVGRTLQAFAEQEGLRPQAWMDEVAQAHERLRLARERRVRPHRDDKILTGWNALAIAALARAGRVFAEPAWIEAALRAHAFLQARLRRPDGRWLARYRDGEAAHPAYAEDYAYLVWAALELYEATFHPAHLAQALEWQTEMQRLFWDDAAGGYFFYGVDGEPLIARPKEVYDGATPSANSAAAWNLVRIARITGDPLWSGIAERQLAFCAAEARQHPAGYTHFCVALLMALGPGREIVIAGPPEDPEVAAMRRVVQRAYLPNAILLAHDGAGEQARVAELAPFVAQQGLVDGRPAAYVCERYACRQPVFHADALSQALQEEPFSAS
ncbi:MAG: thioredoxin domain-containing protein [Alicyclobacillus sp.]|nr:thioredoxin domain-containing protein [Alicyclobacillus sp.]